MKRKIFFSNFKRKYYSINLNYESYESNSKDSIIILHALFGNLHNFKYISLNNLKLKSNFNLILPDLRNHGNSKHLNSMSYNDMTDDIIQLMDHLNIEKSHFIGQ